MIRIKGVFLVGLGMALALASCQGAVDLSSSSAQDGEEMARLTDKQNENGFDGLKSILHGKKKGTATPEADNTQEATTPTPMPLPIFTSTPTPTPLPIPTSAPTQLPTATAPPLSTEPAAPVTVSYAEIFPGGSEMSRGRPLDFAIKAEFNSSVSTELFVRGFFIYQGQQVPAGSTCGQIPERSLAGFTWSPAPSVFGPGNQSFNDWGYIAQESMPVDATHLTVLFAIKTRSDSTIRYCLQKTYLLIDEPPVPPATADPSSIKVMSVMFWPDTGMIDRYGTRDFGARLDFESIVMSQARLLAFFIYQGQEIPGEMTCLSGQMPGQSGGTFWITGISTRMWTGVNRFEQPYIYSAAAPNNATHLVMWLLLEEASGRPILCWQKVIELSPVSQ